MEKIKIAGTAANRMIGEGEPCFIIAEAGVNHNGDLDLALKLIDVAAEAGADAVKFQTFKTDQVVTLSVKKADYQKVSTGAAESQFDMIKRLELTESDFRELSAYAQRKHIVFLSTPFDKGSVDLLDKLNVPAFKIASGEITNFPLLKYIAQKRKPIILSTGMSTLDEVREALQVLELTDAKVILLHCISSYPTPVEDMNLRAMETLKQAFRLPVGLSDHSQGITVSIAAVALGACVLEKHFTLDKNLPGPDHKASLEPQKLRLLVRAIRDVEKAMGNGVKKPTPDEEKTKEVARRSIVAAKDIAEGATIIGEMLDVKRAGVGIEPKHICSIMGRTARERIRKGEMIAYSQLV